jgi:hypothetical protein
MLIVAGGAALLIALVLLYQSTRSDAVPLRAAAPTTSDRTEAPSAPAPSAAVAAPDRPVAPPKPSAPVVAAPPAPRLENILPSAATEPAPGTSNEGIHFGAPQLQTQTKAVEPLVRECVEKAAVTGDRSSGTAIVTYVVAKRGDKYVVEDPGTEPDKTTVQNDALLECLAGTAKAMKFEGLPRGANEIYVTRKVTLEGGKLTDYKHVAFSYLR